MPEGKPVAAAVVDAPGAEAESGQRPDDNSAGVEEGVAGLVRRSKAGAGRPEDKSGSAAQVLFRDESKLTAVSAAGVIVSESQIRLFRNRQPIFLDFFNIERSIGKKRRSLIDEGDVVRAGGKFALLLTFDEFHEGWIVFLEYWCAHQIKIAIAVIGVA